MGFSVSSLPHRLETQWRAGGAVVGLQLPPASGQKSHHGAVRETAFSQVGGFQSFGDHRLLQPTGRQISAKGIYATLFGQELHMHLISYLSVESNLAKVL